MLEAELRDVLAAKIDALEGGLTLVQKEKYIPSKLGTRSFIDLLAQDTENRWVLIELKRSDAAAREAIHEIYKYVEGVKAHLRARDDEIRTMIVSTDWKELLVPFSRFAHETNIAVKGLRLEVEPSTNLLLVTTITPLPITAGRILSPWHEISLYRSEERLSAGIASYDASCKAKGIDDYVLLTLVAPQGFYEKSVVSTANALASIQGQAEGASTADIGEMFQKMPRLDWMIYFVPQLLTAEAYLKIIEGTPALFEEAKDFQELMSEEEALCSLQGYALDAAPKVERDYFEIGYAAKFQSKLLDEEGWTIREILRRGAFDRNSALTDDTILREIAGEAGTSGQRFKRSVKLGDKAAFSSALSAIKDCLANNPAWASQIVTQLEEARSDFPEATANISVFSPSTGVFTIFFTTTRDDGYLYVPSYSIEVVEAGLPRRLFVGELTEADDIDLGPSAFSELLTQYYNSDLGILVMSMTSGGYESRDAEILADLNLDYTSFRCDLEGDRRKFFRSVNSRWRIVGQIEMFGAYNAYIERNKRIVKIIDEKIGPRVGAAICDGSSARHQLEALVDLELAAKAENYVGAPDACDICQCPLSLEPFMSDAQLKNHSAWANMCTDCTIYHAKGIGWGTGQLYRNEGDNGWLLVAGAKLEDSEKEE